MSGVPVDRKAPIQEIPLVDLHWQHHQVAEDVERGFKQVMSDASFILGPSVELFEREFASYVGVEHCIGVANGTDALELGLRALGVGSGDEVIVPTNSFVASALAVVRTGARPVLVDVDPDTHLIDLNQVESSLTVRTRAVMPVHLYGQMAPMHELRSMLEGLGVFVVEDGAQAHGSSHDGASMGQLSDIAATSFYPGKNLGAYGDGGAVLADDSALADRVRKLRNLGSTTKHDHSEIGFNSRLDSLQAVVLSAKLGHLDDWNSLRRQVAARYYQMLEGVDQVRLPVISPANETNWHLFVIRTANRNSLLAELEDHGIHAGIHYPVPIHLQRAFDSVAPPSLPVSERLAREILSLPIFPGLTVSDQDRIVSHLIEILN